MRDQFNFLERRHGLAVIIERGAWVIAERLRVNPPHPEREISTLSEHASRHGNRSAQQRLGFLEALVVFQGPRIIVGCYGSSVRMGHKVYIFPILLAATAYWC